MRAFLSGVMITLQMTSLASSQSLPSALLAPLSNFTSSDSEVRTQARDQFQKLFANYTVQQRKDAVTALLAQIHTRSNDTPSQINAATALAKLAMPWEANNHDEGLDKLYNLAFQDTKDPTFQRYLDDALANGKGLYLDAIADFNFDRVSNPAAVAAKFQRVTDRFLKSRYAANAAFYLQQYWTRAAILRNRIDEYIPQSNTAFDTFQEKAMKGQFSSNEFNSDAVYFRALNDVLQKKENLAKSRLLQLRSNLGKDKTIYVYQLFKRRGDEGPEAIAIDRFIPADILITETVDFMTTNPGRLPDAQNELASRILARLTKKG